MPGLVLVFEDDLLFAPRIEMGLRANGYKPRFVTRTMELGEALKAAPVLVLANIGSRAVPWTRLVGPVKERRPVPNPFVVGYGPHVDLDLRQQALDVGCDAVVGRSAIASNLGSLLDRYAWKPELTACDAPLPGGIRKGVEQFNNRAFYRCHDSIEEVWSGEPGDVRLMYQGLLQLSVAFYHVQQRNWRGMVRMLARGKGKLLPFLPACQEVDVAGLLADVERCEVALRDMRPDKLADLDPDLFPIIRMTR